MLTVPIAPTLPPGAHAALGGPPVALPPLAALAPPPSAEPAAPPPPSFLTGVSTFDPEPPEVASRRAQVAQARAILRGVMEAVMAANDALTPILNELAPQTDGGRADGFDPNAARALIQALADPIRKLTAPPAPAKAKDTAKPAL